MELCDKKTLVKENIISAARLYNDYFMNYDYLLCSPAFHRTHYYLVTSYADNFRHLTGVHTLISPTDFFYKSFSGILTEDDFEFVRKGCTERDAMECVVNKLKVFPHIVDIFTEGSMVEENFARNQIRCLFAVRESFCTMGFTNNDPARPMTLLKGNKLDPEKSGPLELVLRKSKASGLFDEIVLGDDETLSRYYNDIKSLLSPDVRPRM